jgi:UDP-N-acetylglucosamine--N-acetylmuramyl-(pentapeptide) pyrophosphoryl-undecaprenol N-acetylglucosamine transferase
MMRLFRATRGVKAELTRQRPDAVFSTGGYSGAPVMYAARALGIPYIIHEQNSIPGRSNLMFGKKAYCIATTFRATAQHFQGCRVERLGLPVRSELRELAQSSSPTEDIRILVVGGSQGAAALNQSALETAERSAHLDWHWLHITGKAHFDDVFHSYKAFGLSSCYEVKAFLEGKEMGRAYAHSSLAVCRSGASTLSELAAFRLPSILVPYPYAFANHQHYNAKEFEEMGAAIIIPQTELHSALLEESIRTWLSDSTAMEVARAALAEWDSPDAAQKVLELVSKAVVS